MEEIKYTITTDIQERQELKSIDMLTEALERLKRAQEEKNTVDGHVFVSIECVPQIEGVSCIQVSYYYDKKAGFFRRFFNSDEFYLEIILSDVQYPSNQKIRALYTGDVKAVENIIYNFVEKQTIPDFST